MRDDVTAKEFERFFSKPQSSIFRRLHIFYLTLDYHTWAVSVQVTRENTKELSEKEIPMGDKGGKRDKIKNDKQKTKKQDKKTKKSEEKKQKLNP